MFTAFANEGHLKPSRASTCTCTASEKHAGEKCGRSFKNLYKDKTGTLRTVCSRCRVSFARVSSLAPVTDLTKARKGCSDADFGAEAFLSMRCVCSSTMHRTSDPASGSTSDTVTCGAGCNHSSLKLPSRGYICSACTGTRRGTSTAERVSCISANTELR